MSTLKLLPLLIIWLRITLSYCVIGGLVVSLLSAYIGSINVVLISIIMLLSFCLGLFQAERIRRTGGLYKYQKNISNYEQLDN